EQVVGKQSLRDPGRTKPSGTLISNAGQENVQIWILLQMGSSNMFVLWLCAQAKPSGTRRTDRQTGLLAPNGSVSHKRMQQGNQKCTFSYIMEAAILEKIRTSPF